MQNHPKLAIFKDSPEVADFVRMETLKSIYGVVDKPKEEDTRPLPAKVVSGVYNFGKEMAAGIVERAIAPYKTWEVNHVLNRQYDQLKTLRDQYRELSKTTPTDDPKMQALLASMQSHMDNVEQLLTAQTFATRTALMEGAGLAAGEGIWRLGGKAALKAAPYLFKSPAGLKTLANILKFSEGKVAGYVVKPATRGAVDMATLEGVRSVGLGDTPEDAAKRIQIGAVSGALVAPLFHGTFAGGSAVLRRIPFVKDVINGAGDAINKAHINWEMGRNKEAHASTLSKRTLTPEQSSEASHRVATQLVEGRFPGASDTPNGRRLILEVGNRIDSSRLTPEDVLLKKDFVDNSLPNILKDYNADLTKGAREEAERIVREHLTKQGEAAGLAGAELENFVNKEAPRLDRIALVEDKIKAAKPAAPSAEGTSAPVKVAPTPDTTPADGVEHIIRPDTPDSKLPKYIIDPNTRLAIPIRASGNRRGAPLNLIMRVYKRTDETVDPALKEALWREIWAANNNGVYPQSGKGVAPKGLEAPSWYNPDATPPVAVQPTSPAPGEAAVDAEKLSQFAVNLDKVIEGKFHADDPDTPDYVVRPMTLRDELAKFVGDRLDEFVHPPEGVKPIGDLATLRTTMAQLLKTAGFNESGVTAVRRIDNTVEYTTLETFIDDFLRSVIEHKQYKNPSWGRTWRPSSRGILPEVDKGSPEVRALKEQYRVDNNLTGEADLTPRQHIPHNPGRHARIAQLYEESPVVPTPENEAATRAAYDALNEETARQYKAIQDAGYTIEVVEQDPYKNSAEMMADVRENKRLKVLAASEGHHPYMSKEQTEMFRAVHDFFGHNAEGYQFGVNGEEGAFHTHASMYSEAALPAMVTETRGQNSWFHYGPNSGTPIPERPFAVQKAIAMPRETFADVLHGTDNAAANEALLYNQINGRYGSHTPDFEALNAAAARDIDARAAADAPQGETPTSDWWSRWAQEKNRIAELERRDAEIEARKAANAAEEKAAQEARVERVWGRALQVAAERESRPARIAHQKELRRLGQQLQLTQSFFDRMESPTSLSGRGPTPMDDPAMLAHREMLMGFYDRMQTAPDEVLAQHGYWRNPLTGEAEQSPYLMVQIAERGASLKRAERALASIGEQATTASNKPMANTFIVAGKKVNARVNESGDAISLRGKVSTDVLRAAANHAHANGTAIEVSVKPISVKGKPPEFDAARVSELAKMGFYQRSSSPTEMVFRFDPPEANAQTITPLQALELSYGNPSGAKTFSGLDVHDAFVLNGASAPGSPLVP